MAQSVGEVALDIVAGKNTVNSAVSGAMNDVQNTVNKGSSGISNALGKVGSVAGSVVKGIGVGIGAASTAVIGLGKQSIDAYANYEQLVGGVKTLFGESADIVMGYADNAYKSAGMSANAYMETVTGFSASLLQSLGGDTAKASEYADRAITDMADNANKMGTDMQMIQNAYQGFAKQNYTMLDNLKLGYGGTQSEMQRLISEASQMTDEMAELGVTVDGTDMSFGNIVNAISVVQKHMDITGTTVKEAGSTIQGSIASMGSAWQNLLTGLSDPTQNLDQLITNFVDSVGTVGENIIPRIGLVLDGIVSLITQLAPKLIAEIPNIVSQLLPAVIDGAVGIINAIVQTLPQLVTMIVEMLPQFIEGITQIFNGIVEALPSLIQTICEALPTLIPALIDGLVSMIVTLATNFASIIQPIIDNLPEIIISIVNALMDNLPALIQGCVALVVGLVEALPQIIMALIEALPTVLTSIVDGLIASAPVLLEGVGTILSSILPAPVGEWMSTNVIQPIVESFTGLCDNIKNIWTNIKTAISGAVNAIKNFVVEKFTAIKDGVTNIVTRIKNVISNIFSGIKNTITNVITTVKTVISNGFNVVKSTVFGIFDGIKNKISNIMDGAKNIISGAIKKIKGFFNFEWSLPKLKMPHFSIDGKFSLNPPSIPKFSIDWYAKAMDKGMILNSPTIFGASGENLLGAGEAGSETVVGTNSLMSMIQSAVSSAIMSVRMAVEAPALNNVRAGSSTAMQDESKIDKLIELIERLVDKDDDQTPIPIYIGNELIEEYIINKNGRKTIRSGGHA